MAGFQAQLRGWFWAQDDSDMTPEANETFYVDLSNIVNAMFGDLQGLATILNDD